MRKILTTHIDNAKTVEALKGQLKYGSQDLYTFGGDKSKADKNFEIFDRYVASKAPEARQKCVDDLATKLAGDTQVRSFDSALTKACEDRPRIYTVGLVRSWFQGVCQKHSLQTPPVMNFTSSDDTYALLGR